ncbi:MAG: thioredoxin domain-containing protein [Flavobacteriales bacterium]
MMTTNALIHETSPYLLQHAHNPVDWLPWGEIALRKAIEENKPILVSIGYSACHWCHVMEHESFEDPAVAKMMNENFICIKVDREERPDVDQVYMDAIQLMTGSGGWPLNCFALPDGRPFYGGTYFRKDQWMQALKQISSVYQNDREKAEEYATKLTEGLSQMDQMPLVQIPDQFNDEVLETAVARWRRSFDMEEGGPNYSPKFPMPNNYQFLLSYARSEKDHELENYVHLTLKKMARGGIYDQLGGGFARYSTDEYWKVPHFEKMLYDNGQLLTLYSQAYSITRDAEYKRVVEETASWIRREMMSDQHVFYSAKDADSEGEEGKFYIWTKDELETLAGEDFAVISDYYNVNKKGLWEHGKYILLRNRPDSAIANEHSLSEKQLQDAVDEFKSRAFESRERRIRPGLDDKTLTSWNAMTAKGLLDAYAATSNSEWLELAKRSLDFLTSTQMSHDARLNHSYKDGRSTINGYLEDYAFLIDALLRHYELTFDESSIIKVKKLVEYVFAHFDQNDNGFFYFKSKLDTELVAKKVEIHDNVIPASNSVLATCFYKLGLLLSDSKLIELSQRMLAQVEPNIAQYPTGHSQWMALHQMNSRPYFEIAIVGKDCLQKLKELTAHYLPNAVICGGETEGRLPILEHRLVEGKTLIYVCQNGACKLPVETIEEALAQLAAN